MLSTPMGPRPHKFSNVRHLPVVSCLYEQHRKFLQKKFVQSFAT